MIVCLGAGAKHRREGGPICRRPTIHVVFRSDPIQAAEALRWWVRAGVDAALDETPHDRFAESAGADRRAGRMRRRARACADSARDGLARAPERRAANRRKQRRLRLARSLKAATDLEMLRSAMAEFDGCALKRTATQLVFADGVPGSRLMFVGEAPGGDEDRIGRPFVGRAGQLLDRMLGAIGLDRRSVYIANVVPWRPPGNRTPTLQETQACLPFIRRQIDLADPEFLVCLGGSAVQTLLGVQGGITRVAGLMVRLTRAKSGRPIRALAMFHPAYLLRQPAQKRLAWADMRALADALNKQARGD